ncbi:MAG: hypothetical protein HC836_42505 [Richelia sp. RM2_1_2]|nr:hypothetical protein [Richelia sp. SM2_1_7]NJM21766.1 hypothetical protein [Richelia sp. SM1_7_0]NJN12338.1 hypothetical protein [Richelia sp. RM1_1_1]NJO30698.1 hypothetical protein [Richelia sp. SL_2_1]NJO64581.1 hypothetical protein [Richelia sp. RM2_1_2]
MKDKDKTLATFRIEPKQWEAFKTVASDESSNASAVLNDLVAWYLAGNRINKLDDNIDTNLDAINEKIDKRIDETLDSKIDEHIDKKLDVVLKELGELREKLPA